MDDKFITDNNILLLRQRKKFGLDYFEAAVEKKGSTVYFPYFLSVPMLNAELIKIVDACSDRNENIDISLVFASNKFISLSVKGLYSINYSLDYNAFLPFDMILKLYDIKKKYYKRVLFRIKKQYYVVESSLRCAADGIRVDVVDKKTLIKSPLKIRNVKKISQIT